MVRFSLYGGRYRIKIFLDGILHIYDEGRTKVSMGELFGIVTADEERLADKNNAVAP